jgi:hypothetical protein
MMLLDEAQELFVLIDHARDGDSGLERAGEQRLRVLRLHESFGIGNRIAVRIRLGPSEHFVDAIDQAIGDGVLEEFGFVVHLVPRVAHDPHEKKLDEAMTPEDERSQFLSAAVSATPAYGSYSTSPDSASVFTIVVAVPGVTPTAAASWPMGRSR